MCVYFDNILYFRVYTIYITEKKRKMYYTQNIVIEAYENETLHKDV